MNAPDEALRQAEQMLRQNAPTAAVLELLAPFSAEHASFARAQFLRGLCALHDGQGERARTLLTDAFRRGEQHGDVVLALARAAVLLGMPDDLLTSFSALLARAPQEQLLPFSAKLLQVLGFTSKQATPANAAVFEKLVLPLIELMLDRGDMDGAIAIEKVVYDFYVKATETEAHFAAVMGRLEPLFTAAGRAWRSRLPPVAAATSLEPPYRVGFFIHSASMLAHIEVLLNALKGYRLLDDQPFEPVVYCFSGNSAPMEAALADLGVRLVMLHDRYPETARSSWQRLLRLRDLLAEEGVQELVWISLVTMMPLAFGMRIAPVQTWFAMKYRNFAQPDIDGYVSGSALTRFGTIARRRWRMTLLGVDDWYDAALETKAAEIRSRLAGKLILMTLARTEKMTDPRYLGALVEILRANPDTVFLWAGREKDPQVVRAFHEGGVLDRTHFIGWVNTRLYAQVADVFLDTFPFPCGFTLFQAMAAGKPAIIYDSPEAAQTGLWNFLKPLIDGDEGAPEQRAELRGYVGDIDRPRIGIARSPDDYVRLATRLVTDPAARAEAGEAGKAFIRRYFSDPAALGASVSDHLVELIEARRALMSPS